MDDRALITLAAIEDHSAREEILKRHIMDVDNVDYKQANKTFTTQTSARARNHKIQPPQHTRIYPT